MTLWSILAAPLLAGNDLRNVSPAILEILTNREVISVNQDKEGKQGKRVWKSGDQEIWTRALAGGALAVALFNRSTEPAKVSVRWEDLGIKGKARLRDLWLHQDVEWQGPEYTTTVPGHGAVLLGINR